MKKFLLPLLYLSAPLLLLAQKGDGKENLPPPPSGDFDYGVRVDEVYFDAPEGHPSLKIDILRDYDPNPTIEGPAWKYPSTENPVAFASGKAVQVSATFKLNGCLGELWAQGDGPGGYDPPAQKMTQGFYPSISLPIIFPEHTVDFYEPFDIKWYISNSPDGPWIPAGNSKNPLYIIYGTVPVPPGVKVFHSLIYYGCKNAKGLTSPNMIVDEIYTKTFGNRTVPRKDSPTKPAMSYWIQPDPSGQEIGACYFETQDLLKWENGRCGAWARFFRDMTLVQGISGAEIAVVTYSSSSLESSYFLDKWSFFGSSAVNVTDSGIDPKFFVNKFDLGTNKFYSWNREWMPLSASNISATLPNGNVLKFAPLDGAEGQGNGNPMSTFGDHALIKYNSKYYDPSYGTPIQADKNSWETASLAGFGTAYSKYSYVIGGALVEIYLMYLHESNNATLQSTIQP